MCTSECTLKSSPVFNNRCSVILTHSSDSCLTNFSVIPDTRFFISGVQIQPENSINYINVDDCVNQTRREWSMNRHLDSKTRRTQWKAWHYQIPVILYYVGSPTPWNQPRLCLSGLCLVLRQTILCGFQSMEKSPRSEENKQYFFSIFSSITLQTFMDEEE